MSDGAAVCATPLHGHGRLKIGPFNHNIMHPDSRFFCTYTPRWLRWGDRNSREQKLWLVLCMQTLDL